MRYYSLNYLRPARFMLLRQVLSRGLTEGDTIRNLGVVGGGLEGGDSRQNSREYVGNVGGKTHGENTIPSSQLIDILRSVLVSINIEAIMAESATYGGRERHSKMVDGLELGDAYWDDKRTEVRGMDKSARDAGCDDDHLRPSTVTDFTRRGDSNILAGFSIILVMTYGAF